MKKLLLFVVIAFVSFCANAQFYLGGTAGISVNTVDRYATTSAVICPELGYKFNQIWAVGASIDAGYSNERGGYGIIGFAPYARAIFAHVQSVSFFADAALPYYTLISDGDSESMFSIGLRPGFLVNLNDNLQLQARATFVTIGLSGNNTSIGLAIANEFSLGVIYNF